MLDERPPIARVPFIDGSVRPVHEDADGRLFVIAEVVTVYGTRVRADDAGEPVIAGR
jgi:hypothetical protein